MPGATETFSVVSDSSFVQLLTGRTRGTQGDGSSGGTQGDGSVVQ